MKPMFYSFGMMGQVTHRHKSIIKRLGADKRDCAKSNSCTTHICFASGFAHVLKYPMGMSDRILEAIHTVRPRPGLATPGGP
jgi:hypothetical protein